MLSALSTEVLVDNGGGTTRGNTNLPPCLIIVTLLVILPILRPCIFNLLKVDRVCVAGEDGDCFHKTASVFFHIFYCVKVLFVHMIFFLNQ